MELNRLLQRGVASVPVFVIGLVIGVALKTGADDFWGNNVHNFTKALLSNPREVGAFTPCSKYVVESVVKHVRPKGKLRVLEVGGGTGVLTQGIIKQLVGSDFSLDVIEINSDFCKTLHKQFGGYRGVKIHKVDILQWAPEEQYDIIISALPFNNFSEQFVKDVLNCYQSIIKPGGMLSYIELAMPKRMKSWISGNQNEEYKRKKEFIQNFKDEYLHEELLVKRNIPPIYVYHLRM